MSEIADCEQKEQKTFDYFLNLPEKVRMNLIDEMQPDDRCRLTRCSKQCNKEAKSSKNFINALIINAPSEEHITIRVEFCNAVFRPFSDRMGFALDFKNEWERKFMTYQNINQFRGDCWRIEIDNSIDLLEMAIQIFKNQLQAYQKSVKRLKIEGEMFKENLFDSKIEHFESLQNLTIDGSINVSNIFSKLSKPLKQFVCNGEDSKDYLANHEQIYQVKKILKITNLDLNKEQFSRLTASQTSIHIGQLTEIDIYHFIISWQLGQVRKSFKNCCWDLTGTDFNVKKLFIMFGLEMVEDKFQRFSTNIINHKKRSKVATLRKDGKPGLEILSFFVNSPFPIILKY